MNHIKSAIERVFIILSASFCMFSAVVPVSANTISYGLTGHPPMAGEVFGNVRAVVSKDGADAGTDIDILSATDYYPGGMRLPNRWYVSENYRFGYQGQFAEKDPETGYNQFEARLYDSRILRWNTTDPAGQYFSPYLAMGNNWPGIIDPDGRFDSRKEARMFRRENNIGGQIQKNYNGSYSIVINENTSYYDGMLLEYTNPDASAFPLESVTISTFSSYYSKSSGFSLDRIFDIRYANNIQEYENWEDRPPDMVLDFLDIFPPTSVINNSFISLTGVNLFTNEKVSDFERYYIAPMNLLMNSDRNSQFVKTTVNVSLQPDKKEIQTTNK